MSGAGSVAGASIAPLKSCLKENRTAGAVAEEGAGEARNVMFHEHPVIQYEDASSLVKGGIVWVQDSTISSEIFQVMIVEVHKQRMFRGTRRRKIETAFSVLRCNTVECVLTGQEIFVPLSHCEQVVAGEGAGGASGAGEVGPVAEEDHQLPSKKEMRKNLVKINKGLSKLYDRADIEQLEQLSDEALLARERSLHNDKYYRRQIIDFQGAINQYKELFEEDEFSATCEYNCTQTEYGLNDIQVDLLAEITRRAAEIIRPASG